MAMEVVEEINSFFLIEVDLAEFAAVDDVGSLCRLIASRTKDCIYNPKFGSRADSGGTYPSGSSSASVKTATPDTQLSSDDEKDEETVKLSSPPPSTGDLIRENFKAFDSVRNEFDFFSKETGCDKFWTHVYPRQAGLVAAYVLEAFAKLGCDLSSMKAGQKVPDIPRPSNREKLMVQLLRVLRDDGLVTEDGSTFVRTSKSVSNQSSSERLHRILEDFPKFAPEHRLIQAIGSELAGCLSNDVNPLTLLFGSPEKRKLMADQYTIAPIQSAVSKQLASFIKKRFGQQKQSSPIRVLEIGGGTCGTTFYAVATFAQLGIPVEYTFSDISSSFISTAKTKLKEYKFVDFRNLDITEEPSPEFWERYDMIIATNVIHATPDVRQSVGNARKMLKTGGFLTLVEYTRNLPYLDLVFGQLDGWWLRNDGRTHAIMDEYGWKRTLTSAGFGRVEWSRSESRESEILQIILAC